MKIEQFIREKLTAGAGGQPAFPVFAPERQPLPFVVYQRVSTTRDRAMPASIANPVATFSVIVYASTYSEVRRLSDDIRRELDNFTGDYGPPDNVVAVVFVHIGEEADGEPVQFDGESKPAYSAELQFNVKYKEDCQ